MQDAEHKLVDQYLYHLQHERRLSPHTVTNYRRDLAALTKYCKQQDIDKFSEIDGYHIRQFAADSHRKGMSPRSIQRRLSAVRGFFNYLLREGEVSSNPGADISAPKASKRLPNTMDVDQMARLLKITGQDPITVRDKAIMELLYSSGLRLAELVGLDLNDLDLRDATVRVTGKGSKSRILPVGRHAREALKNWLHQRAEFAAHGETAVFVSRRGGRLSPRSVQARVRYWAKRQGVPVRVYPHLFRHSFATHMLESSQDLRGVQELLGHADISTTQIYTHLDFQHLARIYDKAHPRARKRR